MGESSNQGGEHEYGYKGTAGNFKPGYKKPYYKDASKGTYKSTIDELEDATYNCGRLSNPADFEKATKAIQ